MNSYSVTDTWQSELLAIDSSCALVAVVISVTSYTSELDIEIENGLLQNSCDDPFDCELVFE
jgi:hypothetical protein